MQEHEQQLIRLNKQLEEQKRHLESVYETLQRERDLFVGGPVVVFIWGGEPGWPMEYVSPNVENILGYSVRDMLAKDFAYSSLIHVDDLERVIAEVNEHLASGSRSFEQSYRLRCQTGEYRWMYDFTVPEYDSEGNLLHIRGYMFDQSQLKEIEGKLEHQRQRLASIIDGTHVGTWEWNIQSGECRFNDRWAELIGYTLDELSPTSIQTWLDMAHPDDLEISQRLLAQHFSGERGYYDVECRMRHKNGDWVWVHDRGRIVEFDGNGKPLWMSGTHSDISERKLSEAALHRSNADLEQFAYSVSHDMRQPLRMITGHLQLLERSLANELSEDQLDSLHFAVDGARRMDGMIVSLLDYSRVGRKTSPMQWLSGMEPLQQALLFLEPLISEHGANVEIVGDWPDIHASYDEMVRLFQNLIDNAIKYNEHANSVNIQIKAQQLYSGWQVCVSDNGIGIAANQIDRLFQFFTRLHTRKQFDGTGMGLALCRRIVEHHGGRIWAESDGEGKGSQFCFIFPT